MTDSGHLSVDCKWLHTQERRADSITRSTEMMTFKHNLIKEATHCGRLAISILCGLIIIWWPFPDCTVGAHRGIHATCGFHAAQGRGLLQLSSRWLSCCTWLTLNKCYKYILVASAVWIITKQQPDLAFPFKMRQEESPRFVLLQSIQKDFRLCSFPVSCWTKVLVVERDTL